MCCPLNFRDIAVYDNDVECMYICTHVVLLVYMYVGEGWGTFLFSFHCCMN